MARVGYARVSSRDQNLDSQIDMLTATGCEKIFEDKVSGVKESRPEWDWLLEFLRPGDTVRTPDIPEFAMIPIHKSAADLSPDRPFLYR